jgi:cytochrome b
MTDHIEIAQPGRTTRPGVERKDTRDLSVWDLFVRVFHWSLVILFTASWISGGRWDTTHIVVGYGVLALILQRIAWGFAGPHHARFSSFAFGPTAILGFLWASLRMRAPRHIGHNPAGGAMVIVLLLTLLVISATGIMMTTDRFRGVGWVDQSHAAAAKFSLFLVGLHIAGVILASIEHGENLVKSMFTGRKKR